MANQRFLIVNADDFGRSDGINRGIITVYEHGIVTSASLMVRWPAAAPAADYGRRHPDSSIGLHIDLGEWAYRDGTWVCLYEVVPAHDAAAVADEVTRQLESFRRLMGRDPTHLDSHQHVHRDEPIRSILLKTARALGVPLRQYCPAIRFCGDFYGQTGDGVPYPDWISVKRLLGIAQSLPTGITELACHPGEGDDWDSMYQEERMLEVATLCDPRMRPALAAEGILLRSFGTLPQVACLC